MSPLANENFAPVPGPVRTDDAKRSRQEFAEFTKNFGNRPKTATEVAADNWFQWEKEQDAKREDEEQRRIDEQRRRQEAERQEQERREKRAQFELAEALEEDQRERLGIVVPKQTWHL